jgi:hypothetical protein
MDLLLDITFALLITFISYLTNLFLFNDIWCTLGHRFCSLVPELLKFSLHKEMSHPGFEPWVGGSETRCCTSRDLPVTDVWAPRSVVPHVSYW